LRLRCAGTAVLSTLKRATTWTTEQPSARAAISLLDVIAPEPVLSLALARSDPPGGLCVDAYLALIAKSLVTDITDVDGGLKAIP
jgi:hypothetical protein